MKILGSLSESKCRDMAKVNAPVIFDEIKKKIPLDKLCDAGGLCSLPTFTSNVDAECRYCEIAVGSLESIRGELTNLTVEEDVFPQAIKVCDRMSGRSHSVCVEVITGLLPEIQDVFDIPVSYVCAKLKWCSYADGVDTTACSNPNFWCQDKKIAYVCDRLNYCRKNVWTSSVP